VFHWTARARKWLNQSGSSILLRIPFNVTCACGTSLRGMRSARAQTPTCPTCGRKVFILPFSPLPRVIPESEPASKESLPANQAPSVRRHRRIISIVILFVVLLVTSIALFANRRTDISRDDAPETVVNVENHIALAKRALAEGSFQSALDELAGAVRQTAVHPELLQQTSIEALLHLQRETELLTDLLTEPLEEMVRNLEGLEYRESQAVFRRRYFGKSVVFYTRLRRDPSGMLHIDYRLQGLRHPVRLDLQSLSLFKGIPLEEPVDVLFGVRLASAERNSLGEWVITFQQEGGVFITDEEPAFACCFQPPDPAALRLVLRRQANWLRRN
jgi:hypothetical protein